MKRLHAYALLIISGLSFAAFGRDARLVRTRTTIKVVSSSPIWVTSGQRTRMGRTSNE